MQGTQLELNLWDNLEQAAAAPESANLDALWQQLEAAIAPLPQQGSVLDLLMLAFKFKPIKHSTKKSTDLQHLRQEYMFQSLTLRQTPFSDLCALI